MALFISLLDFSEGIYIIILLSVKETLKVEGGLSGYSWDSLVIYVEESFRVPKIVPKVVLNRQ